MFHVILHIGNKDSVETYLNLMKHIKVWIEDIFELDNFEPTWKSENINSLPNQVFFLNETSNGGQQYCYVFSICKRKKYITRQ